jgi:hypothetical protein
MGQQIWACLALEARQPLRCGAPSSARGQRAPRLGEDAVARPQTVSVLRRRAGRCCSFFSILDRIGSVLVRDKDRTIDSGNVGSPYSWLFCFFLLRIADPICTSLHDLCCSVKNSSVQTKKKNDDQRYAKQDLNLKLSCRKDRGP